MAANYKVISPLQGLAFDSSMPLIKSRVNKPINTGMINASQ